MLGTGELHISQSKYILDLLRRAGLSSSKPILIPMLSSLKLISDGSESYENPTLYRSLVGGLQYATLTHPEISFSVNHVSQFMKNPKQHHWSALKRIIRYLSGTYHHGLCFQKSTDLRVLVFADADWASDIEDHRSTSGYCVFLGYNPVFWCSRKQTAVSRSSIEAEFRCLADVGAEILWVLKLLQELGIPQPIAPTVYCDNLSAVMFSANPILHSRSKHFEVDLHFVQDRVFKGQLRVIHIPVDSQIADVLTKPLSTASFEKFKNKLRVVPQPTMSLRGGCKEPSCISN
ncbi:uncharacterized protein LOC110269212 [Arachis ipaensis]|uniref:uncharacterized protein LOC110269212 n=1 Tax=Arachis ipaensis TaxID=130454 RepID=UPI000A2AF5B3|nr:uncharacterized protein LOC110269212 [Arachis ipaensis]